MRTIVCKGTTSEPQKQNIFMVTVPVVGEVARSCSTTSASECEERHVFSLPVFSLLLCLLPFSDHVTRLSLTILSEVTSHGCTRRCTNSRLSTGAHRVCKQPPPHDPQAPPGFLKWPLAPTPYPRRNYQSRRAEKTTGGRRHSTRHAAARRSEPSKQDHSEVKWRQNHRRTKTEGRSPLKCGAYKTEGRTGQQPTHQTPNNHNEHRNQSDALVS